MNEYIVKLPFRPEGGARVCSLREQGKSEHRRTARHPKSPRYPLTGKGNHSLSIFIVQRMASRNLTRLVFRISNIMRQAGADRRRMIERDAILH